MSRAKLYPVMVTLSLVALLAGACTSQPSTTPHLEVSDATEARDAAVTYLQEHETQNAPGAGIAWREYNATPTGLVGQGTREFVSDEWTVTVSYPVVLLENTVYEVTAFNTKLGWHWKGNVKADGSVTEVSPFQRISQEESQKIAEEFLRNSPTFAFDGIEDTLRLADTLSLRCPYCWAFIFEFDSSQAGYGDRTGQMLAQVITPHRASITVEQGEITYASIDEKWDMIKQEELFSGVEPGTVVIKGEADFVGWITDIQLIVKGDVLSQILVESQADKLVDKYMITVKGETLIFQQDGENRRQVGFEALATTQQVQVWFSGPVKESFPAQVDAKQIVIVE